MEFVFSKILSSINLSDIFAKKLAIQKLLAFIAKFRDEDGEKLFEKVKRNRRY